MPLTREEFLAAIAARKKNVATIDIDGVGEVCIRRLSAADAESTGLTSEDHGPEMVAKVLAASLADQNGNLLFTSEDVKALMETDVQTATRVFAECVRANGLMSEALEEAVKAFSSAQPEPSSSS